MTTSRTPCCCTPEWITGIVKTAAGDIPGISTVLSKKDRRDDLKCRLGSFRMKYRVGPGLYAVGNPGKSTPILVTANYKLSFDMLRKELAGIDAWILVLDTKGINVWCAAGKGTFGTAELVRQIRQTRIGEITDVKTIIVPQLGAPGIQAHVVKKETGFRLEFGPVYAKDIKAFLAAGNSATEAMRTVRFPIKARLELTPVELLAAFKKCWIYGLLLLAVMSLNNYGFMFHPMLHSGLAVIIAGIVAIITGAFLAPLLLPFVPFRSFAIKGWVLGIIFAEPFVLAFPHSDLSGVFWVMFVMTLFPALSSYLALNFTGATPYTSPSGVEQEVKIAVPFYFLAVVVSALALIGFKLCEWGIL